MFGTKEYIVEQEYQKYLRDGRDFISAANIEGVLNSKKGYDKKRVAEIIEKARQINTLSVEETAELLKVDDEELWQRIYDTAAEIKKRVYDNRIVTFAPLYISTLCVNNCQYCGLRAENTQTIRKKLSMDELKKQVEVLTGKIGHKRLIVVYGEHPSTDIDYMAKTIEQIYSVKVKAKKSFSQVRRVNVNAPPMRISDIKRLKDVGIGTYQVFQETYHRQTYERYHPASTIKGDYLWRLYTMHRSLEAGVDDVGIGALFGLYDYRYEVLALVAHAIELEKQFGIGPHTISFPRIEPAFNTPIAENPPFPVSDEAFKKIIAVLRLAVPYTGMIITAREPAHIRREMLKIGITQTDASSNIAIGSYGETDGQQRPERQQFKLGDIRSLDEVIRELASLGYITSFCTAGYRCGRTGDKIMTLLRSGEEGKFCKLNGIITFKEWLDDFASPETYKIGMDLLKKEIQEVKERLPRMYDKLMEYYNRTAEGERDLFF